MTNEEMIIERALQILKKSYRGGEYTHVGTLNLGDILTSTRNDFAGCLCVYIVFDRQARYPVYIGATGRGVERLRDHNHPKAMSCFSQYLHRLDNSTHSWNVIFIRQGRGSRSDLLRNENTLMNLMTPYAFGKGGLPRPRGEAKPWFVVALNRTFKVRG